MLRLMIEPLTAWTDSKGRIRSGLEEVRLLDASAGDLVELGTSGLIGWSLGIVSDDWGRPVHSKPLQGRQTGGVRFAVGHEHAPEHLEELRPLWSQFLRWLGTRGRPGWLFLSDEIWVADQGWRELGPAIEEGVFGGLSLELSRTTVPGRYFIPFRPEDLLQLIDVWWPSPMGMIGGVCFTGDAPRDVAERVAQQGGGSAGDLPYVAQVFCTTSTFDELGFAVLSRAESWDSISRELEQRGWKDDTPVDFIEFPERM